MAMLLTGAAAEPGIRGVGGRRPGADESRDLLEALGSEAWPAAAATVLARCGFRLLAGDGGPSHLLVALRRRPTFQHFDPEAVAYYDPADDGSLVSLDRRTRGVPDQPASRTERAMLWGHIHVVDRIPVENRFLTFGGTLRLAVVDPELTVVDLSSVAPIVRWGGHSQGTDEVAQAIGAFFGRLIVPINFVPGAAQRIDALAPGVLYRAFLADGLQRCAAAERRGLERGRLGSWIAAAWMRARADAEACDAAQRLLRELNLP